MIPKTGLTVRLKSQCSDNLLDEKTSEFLQITPSTAAPWPMGRLASLLTLGTDMPCVLCMCLDVGWWRIIWNVCVLWPLSYHNCLCFSSLDLPALEAQGVCFVWLVLESHSYWQRGLENIDIYNEQYMYHEDENQGFLF